MRSFLLFFLLSMPGVGLRFWVWGGYGLGPGLDVCRRLQIGTIIVSKAYFPFWQNEFYAFSININRFWYFFIKEQQQQQEHVLFSATTQKNTSGKAKSENKTIKHPVDSIDRYISDLNSCFQSFSERHLKVCQEYIIN